MDQDNITIGRMFHGRHALMLVNGVPVNAFTGERAFHLGPPPWPSRKAHAAPEHDAEATMAATPDLADTGPIELNGLDTLRGFRWREDGR